MNLADYVLTHTVRGACTCGRCADAPSNPAERQPTGHTADLMFFQVCAVGTDTDYDDLFRLVEHEASILLDGREHNYLEIGGLVGDQGLALQLMGLGALLGLWDLLTPRSLLGRLGMDERTMMDLAGRGMVTIIRRREDEKETTL